MTNRTSELEGDQVDWEALARYLTGESDDEEADRMNRWLAEQPARADIVARLADAMDRAAFQAPTDLDVESALAAVHTRMNETPVLPLRDRRPASPPLRWGWNSVRAAAAVVALLGGTLLYRQLTDQATEADPIAGLSTFSTPIGERDTIRLPDGSVAVLGPASELTVASGYGESGRQVTLQGEALFEVVHDEERPFTVIAGSAEIVDLGTRFLVEHQTVGGVEVVVTEGSVRVRVLDAPSESGTVLVEGERALLSPDGRLVSSVAPADETDLDWTEGRLVFRESPLAEVRVELRRWYGIELYVDDPALESRLLTATFVESDSAADVLRVLALAAAAEVEMRGDTAIFRATRLPGGR